MTAAMGEMNAAPSSAVGAAHLTAAAQDEAVIAVKAGRGLMGILGGIKALVVAGAEAFVITLAALQEQVALVATPVVSEVALVALGPDKGATGVAPAGWAALVGLVAPVAHVAVSVVGKAALVVREAQAGRISGAVVAAMAMLCLRVTAMVSFKA
jgi:hypothetical protein